MTSAKVATVSYLTLGFAHAGISCVQLCTVFGYDGAGALSRRSVTSLLTSGALRYSVSVRISHSSHWDVVPASSCSYLLLAFAAASQMVPSSISLLLCDVTPPTWTLASSAQLVRPTRLTVSSWIRGYPAMLPEPSTHSRKHSRSAMRRSPSATWASGSISAT
jgi:hypothetical protein